MKPLVITVALALGTCLPLQAQTSQSIAKVPASPAWVQTSNGYAQILLNAQAPFQPEYASFFGVPGYDDQVVDLGPDNAARYRDAMRKARATLQTKLTTERDANVRQDLQIMIGAAEQNIEGSELNERYLLPWAMLPRRSSVASTVCSPTKPCPSAAPRRWIASSVTSAWYREARPPPRWRASATRRS